MLSGLHVIHNHVSNQQVKEKKKTCPADDSHIYNQAGVVLLQPAR